MKNLTAKDKKVLEENDKEHNLLLDKIKSEINKLQTPNEKIDWIQGLIKENAFWNSKNLSVQDHEFTAAKKKNFVDWMQLELSYWQKKQEQATPTIPDQVNPKPDRRFNHTQQMLLLERLGIIGYRDKGNHYMKKFNLTDEKLALLISKIIGKDAQNTREYLGTRGDPKHKNAYNTPKNNMLIDQLFTDLGIF